MSLFVDFALVSLFVGLIGMAVISGFILSECIKEDDAVSAWVWGALFVASAGRERKLVLTGGGVRDIGGGGER